MRIMWCGVVALALLAGCARRVETSEATKAVGPEVADFYPLAVGNSWTYQARFLGEEREQKVEIVSRDAGGFFRDSLGNALVVDAFGLRDDRRYLLRAPVKEGTQWTNVVSVSAVEKYRILHAGSPCQVPAGKFEGCVKVEGRARVDAKTTLINELTFAPRVGMVRVETFAETAGKRIPQTVLSLQSYSLGQKPQTGEAVQ